MYRKDGEQAKSNKKKEQDLITQVSARYPDAKKFFYPAEMSTSQYLLKNVKDAGQKSVLTNGLIMSQRMIDNLKQSEVKAVKVTLFSTAKEQSYWQQVNEQEYWRIRKNIDRATKNGLDVIINTVLWRDNIDSIGDISQQAYDLGASKVIFLRYMEREWNDAIIMKQDMGRVVTNIERAKLRASPRLQLAYSFGGPYLFNKTLDEAAQKLNRGEEQGWVNSKYLCPAIDQDYLCISGDNNKVSWCFWLKNDPMGEIGFVDEQGKVNITKKIDFRPETLMDKLEGQCSSEECEYQQICLGGCRRTALVSSAWKGKANIYAEMDICTTKSYKELYE